jgi:hypothetical protein
MIEEQKDTSLQQTGVFFSRTFLNDKRQGEGGTQAFIIFYFIKEF